MTYRRTAAARQQEREATERRMRRMFLIGLIAPCVAFTVAALLIRPSTLLQWFVAALTVPAASTAVAVVYIVRSRREEKTA
ncbi:hypothetical protein MQE23_08460 [Streptomyces sp. HP-A2021]|uniref:hypothetical protein n=1 Tax=Streptomyces sp. HP-A2021 TaxID=2927875 RepID=UPI001FAFCBC4|nr:hypothetical protein [Streptomyces sp. HP-A2021]UOB09083.1 hypothetical protein MQE23_08460 [Streptomyces sp. HP-A2021]